MYENVSRWHEEKKARKFLLLSLSFSGAGMIGGLVQRLSRWDNAVCGGPPPSTHLSFSAAFCNPLGITEQETMRPFLYLR